MWIVCDCSGVICKSQVRLKYKLHFRFHLLQARGQNPSLFYSTPFNRETPIWRLKWPHLSLDRLLVLRGIWPFLPWSPALFERVPLGLEAVYFTAFSNNDLLLVAISMQTPCISRAFLPASQPNNANAVKLSSPRHFNFLRNAVWWKGASSAPTSIIDCGKGHDKLGFSKVLPLFAYVHDHAEGFSIFLFLIW